MWFLRRTHARSTVLIDTSASSVAGAYAHYVAGSVPVLYFCIREQIVARAGETPAQAMLRTLEAVGHELITKGAPVLRRETGSGHVDQVLVSLGAPWQRVGVREQLINPGKPFIFTKRILSEVLSSGPEPAPGRVSGGEAVIATLLNGYAIPNPIGKEARRAVISVLSSSLDKEVAEQVRMRIRKLYHAHTITITAFGAVAYAAMHRVYPHEKDFLILSVSGSGTDVACVKEGRLVNVGSASEGTTSFAIAASTSERMPEPARISLTPTATKEADPRKAWLAALITLFKSFAEHHALPRTMFLVADADSREYLRQALNGSVLHALWLSDEPLSIVPIVPEHLQAHIRNKSAGDNDLYLSLIAIYQGTVT